ncbi:hypothetical protein CTRI78_v011068 [Colletotrichum trifolii]|uniref:Chromo domain-containing protein n=1 Tax=Colletotrichum trifolii TaxID=5466 RepID=A0A4R8QPE8_COLTR|nr:hypothetical protein CTRI78_v011068 [Colletotrichum trifolii]
MSDVRAASSRDGMTPDRENCAESSSPRVAKILSHRRLESDENNEGDHFELEARWSDDITTWEQEEDLQTIAETTVIDY